MDPNKDGSKYMTSQKTIKAFAEAAQSLKLYRRAELVNESDQPLIEQLYVDPLQNDGVLDTILRPNTTFLIGRKGTGKSTIFQRSQHQIRQNKKHISTYVDIKTVFETSMTDTDLSQKVASLGGSLSKSDIERILLYRSFTRAVFEDIQKELRDQISSSIIQKFKEVIAPRRNEVIEAIDELLDGTFEAELTDVTGVFSAAIANTTQQSTSKRSARSLGGKVTLSQTDPSADLTASKDWENKGEHSSLDSSQFSQVLLRTFNINGVMQRLQDILTSIGIRHLYIFIDDFSELPREAMMVFVDTVLAPLNNWSNELIKFKVAAYPGRVYLGKIDPTKIDEVYLDLFRLYGLGDVSTMEEKAIDFTRRLINSRFQHFLKSPFDTFCEGDADETYRQLFYASTANPRVLGHLLHNLSESHVAYDRLIGTRAVQEAASRYYEEKVEPFFGIQKFAHESFDERSSLFSLKELMETLVKRARELRDYKGSAVTRELRGRTPSSHFHILSDLESLVSTLELNFFISKYFEMKDRDGRKVAVYALNYGLCAKHSISFGRPSGKREHRLYFVERIFDYSTILRSYLQKNQEIRCDGCGALHGLDKLEGIRMFDMLCPTCKTGKCQVSNLSRKYETVLKEIDGSLLLPPMELGILETLYQDNSGLAPGEIAAELDCSYQLVGKRGKIMEERGLVGRDLVKGRRRLTITDEAKESYFRSNTDRKLDIDDD